MVASIEQGRSEADNFRTSKFKAPYNAKSHLCLRVKEELTAELKERGH
jgi:hypothetical protein